MMCKCFCAVFCIYLASHHLGMGSTSLGWTRQQKMRYTSDMPKLQTFIVRKIPASFHGWRSRAPLTDRLRANAKAEDFPDLVAEGISGAIYVEAISAYSGRNHADGSPMLWRVVLATLEDQ
jgi:hypothetical protein